MIICNQNQKNTIALTLSECLYDISTTGTTTGFTLSLIDDTTLQQYTGITITNLSTSAQTDRFDSFYLYLTGSTAVNYSTSRVYLPNNGLYTYKVYYNVDTTSTLIEQGIMRVEGSNIITTYTYEKTNSFITYKKQ